MAGRPSRIQNSLRCRIASWDLPGLLTQSHEMATHPDPQPPWVPQVIRPISWVARETALAYRMRARGRRWSPPFPALAAVELVEVVGVSETVDVQVQAPSSGLLSRAPAPTVNVTPETSAEIPRPEAETTWLVAATLFGGWFGDHFHEPWVGALGGLGGGWYLWACCWYPDRRPRRLLDRVRRRHRDS